jgi:thiamine pyrophosphate-dependent acetolactate synthase large subunit-like protein
VVEPLGSSLVGVENAMGLLNSAGVGTALGQANGIQAQDLKRQVTVLSGDGGMNMLLGEFMTAVQYRRPLKIVALTIRRWD